MDAMVPRFRHWRPRVALAAALSVMLACGNGMQAMPAAPVAELDLARYHGRWYVIAQAPAGEPRALGAYFEFRARDGGGIEGLYASRPSFDREPVTEARNAEIDPKSPGRWRMRSGWLRTDEHRVLYVSPDYRFAIAGVPARREAWILARAPVIAEWSYAGLLARLAVQGYDVSEFRRVPQTPEQMGRPGFQ